MFVLIFKPRALSREPSVDRVMPRARAQASHGNIAVLSLL